MAKSTLTKRSQPTTSRRSSSKHSTKPILTEEQMPATIGTPAPEFSLKDQNQQEVRLSDFHGKKRVVLVFHPLDWSPVCTTEHACCVNDMKQFEQLDAQVLGLSVDSVWSHKAWAEKMGIRYPLLADFHPRGAVASKFGAYRSEERRVGKECRSRWSPYH